MKYPFDTQVSKAEQILAKEQAEYQLRIANMGHKSQIQEKQGRGVGFLPVGDGKVLCTVKYILL